MPTIKGRGKTDVYVIATHQGDHPRVAVQFIRNGKAVKTANLRPEAAIELAMVLEDQANVAEAKPLTDEGRCPAVRVPTERALSLASVKPHLARESRCLKEAGHNANGPHSIGYRHRFDPRSPAALRAPLAEPVTAWEAAAEPRLPWPPR